MSAEKIHNLLNRSDDEFLKRNLKMALKNARKALELSEQDSYTKGILQSNLLLGKIYTTTGRFQAEQGHYPTALNYINRADELSQNLSQNGHTIEICLAYGDVYQNQLILDKAASSYQRALDYGRNQAGEQGVIRSLCALSNHYVLKKKLDKAFELVSEALELLNDDTPASLKVAVYNQLCQVYIKKQEYANVLDYSNTALKLSRETGEIEKELIALNNIAVYHGTRANYKTAMEHLLEALEKSKSINFRYNTSQSLINIATIYASLYNYQEAINRYETVLASYDNVMDDYTKVIVLNNLGNIYYQSDDPQKAIDSFEIAYQMAKKIAYKEMIAHCLAQRSRAKAALRDFNSALVDAEIAQDLFSELGDINGKQINLINFGNIYFHKKAYDEAIKLTSLGIVAAKRMKDEESEIRGYQILAKIYQETEDFQRALDYQLIYSKAQERFAKEQRSRQVLDMEIQFAIREKQKEIEQLTKENEYQALLLEQSDQIANQNVQLLQVNEELRQFAYVASHDLKEPLRMIGSYTQLIHRKFEKYIDEQSAPFFEYVSEGVIRMNNLLDALLKYATIGKTELEIETVNLQDVLDISKINLQVSIEETDTEIIVDEPLPIVRSVQSLLIQLFQNLLSNAIKFRKDGCKPQIHVYAKEDSEYFKIFIKDNGIGIDPEFQERIFVIFQRLHTRNQYEGTGIGLAVCQKIVQRLGGTINVNAQLGEGATFSFTIPKR